MTVFGTVINLPHKAGTITFIVVLIFLMVFEGGQFTAHCMLMISGCSDVVFDIYFLIGLHEMESACEKHGLQGLVKKLYKEFMILGLISFALFIITELYELDPYNEWYGTCWR